MTGARSPLVLMPLEITDARTGQTQRVTVSWPTERDAESEVAMANTVEVEVLRNHTSGPVWHPAKSKYQEQPNVARQKEQRGLVRIVGGEKSMPGPSQDAALSGPSADKGALPDWPLKSYSPAEYLDKWESESEVSDEVQARLDLARRHVEAGS